MSILIKCMEMPTSCYGCAFEQTEENCDGVVIHRECPFVYKGYTAAFDNERRDDCPLIEIPPHGDLIDRSVLEQDAQKRLLMCNKNDNQFQKPYEVMRAIALAPTIIPADESNMDSFIRIFEEDDEEDGMDSFIRILKD